jgi:hypothetical protein
MPRLKLSRPICNNVGDLFSIKTGRINYDLFNTITFCRAPLHGTQTPPDGGATLGADSQRRSQVGRGRRMSDENNDKQLHFITRLINEGEDAEAFTEFKRMHNICGRFVCNACGHIDRCYSRGEGCRMCASDDVHVKSVYIKRV